MPKSKPTRTRVQSRSNAKSDKSKSKTPGSSTRESYANLKKTIEAQARELREALEQQTATSEILRVIASSPTDAQPVFDTIVRNAAQLCEGSGCSVVRFDGELLHLVAQHNVSAEARDAMERMFPRQPTRELAMERAVLDSTVIHVPDTYRDVEHRRDFAVLTGVRALLAAPLLRDGRPIGAIGVTRSHPGAFTDKQIALLKTFADQAVIAIENVRLFQELTEALEQQTATSEILGVIAGSSTDIQPVLDAVIANAVKLSGAKQGHIRRLDGESLRVVAHYNESPEQVEHLHANPVLVSESLLGRAFLERKPIHVLDAREPVSGVVTTVTSALGTRTLLAVPLMREETPIGGLTIWRDVVQPFTDRQIELVKTFADQAVIAIENVRLFQELTEALEQQTATSEILGVIASSPTDIQPVLDTVASNAARLCAATDTIIFRSEGDVAQPVACYGSIPLSHAIGQRYRHTRETPPGRAMLDRKTIHVHDILAELDAEYPESKARQQISGARTILVTPLLREGVSIGAIMIRRTEVHPFSEKQIKLLQTFADQAVIAIENVRLFRELQVRNHDLTEALEQQTATSEILRVIASSPTDLQPVLDVIAESAARLCGAYDASIRLAEGNVLRLVTHQGPIPFFAASELPIDRGSVSGRAVVDRQLIHIEDFLSVAATEFPEIRASAEREGNRTMLAVPLMREDASIGAILIRRTVVDPFTDKQIVLLKTFADQAVIAIENVRLFQELQVRNRDLTEALEQQTATSEILRVIASSPTDLQPVLDVVAENAARLCDAADSVIFRVVGDHHQRVAHYGSVPAPAIPVPITRGIPGGRAVLDRRTIHVHDILAEIESEFPDVKDLQQQAGTRTVLATPLLREGVPIGVIVIRRTAVRPFSEKQIALLKTFADQAVIAIENVRLFQELQARTRELVRSVGELKALGEVGQAVSSTLELETVLTRIASHAVQLSGADGGAIYEYG